MNNLIDEASKESGGLIGKAVAGMLLKNPHIGPWFKNKVADGIVETEKMKAFQNIIRKQIECIPEADRIELNPRLFVQAINAAEPVLLEGDSTEELQKMFARLIAAGCDKAKADFVHPSFSSVLGEMSPIDAQIISLFIRDQALPLVNYKYELEKGSIDFEEDVFLYAPEGVSTEIAAISLHCLVHLGLLEISYGSSFTRKTMYDKYESYPPYIEQKMIINNPDYQRVLKDFPSVNDYNPKQRGERWLLLESQDEYVNASKDKIQQNILLGVRDISLKKGIVKPTAFGKCFLKCCVGELIEE